jgi:hypothetical protein
MCWKLKRRIQLAALAQAQFIIDAPPAVRVIRGQRHELRLRRIPLGKSCPFGDAIKEQIGQGVTVRDKLVGNKVVAGR